MDDRIDTSRIYEIWGGAETNLRVPNLLLMFGVELTFFNEKCAVKFT
jgi:hypothetical protein